MEESTLRWLTDKEREEMEEVCSIGEVPCRIPKRAVSDFKRAVSDRDMSISAILDVRLNKTVSTVLCILCYCSGDR